MTSSDFRQRARDALRGNWLVAIIAGLIASLLGGISSGGGSVDLDFSGEDGAAYEELFANLGITEEVMNLILIGIAALAAVGLVYAAICFVIGSGIAVGYAQFNLDLIRGVPVSVGTVFSRFGMWKTSLVARFLVGLRVFLWSLLFVIPGIIESYSYAVVDLVLADRPYLSSSEAMAESKRLMKGNRWRLFCLEFSFIGWSMLCLLTLGLGALWLVPYTQASRAAFYEEIKRESAYVA